MIGFLLIVAWVLFGVVGLHQAWPTVNEHLRDWWTGGEYVYSAGHVPGVGPRHLKQAS